MCLADQNLLQHQVPWQSMMSQWAPTGVFLILPAAFPCPQDSDCGNLQNCLHLQSMTLYCGQELETGVRSWDSRFAPKGVIKAAVFRVQHIALPSYSLLEVLFLAFASFSFLLVLMQGLRLTYFCCHFLEKSSQLVSLHKSPWVNSLKDHLWVTSLVVQGLRLHTPNAGVSGSIPGQGIRSCMLQLRACMPQLKVQHATAKTWCSHINIKKNTNNKIGRKKKKKKERLFGEFF